MKKLSTFLLIIFVFSQSIAQTVFKFDFTGYTGTHPTLTASTGSATLNQSGLANFLRMLVQVKVLPQMVGMRMITFKFKPVQLDL